MNTHKHRGQVHPAPTPKKSRCFPVTDPVVAEYLQGLPPSLASRTLTRAVSIGVRAIMVQRDEARIVGMLDQLQAASDVVRGILARGGATE